MKIQLLSDVHVEFWRNATSVERHQKLLNLLSPEAEILIVAGDLHTGRKNVLETLTFLAPYFKYVLYTPGNHEYYNGLEIDAFDDYQEFERKLPNNVFYLNPNHIEIEGIRFIGATLWTDFGNNPRAELIAASCITDFRRMKNISTTRMKEENYLHRNVLIDKINEFSGPKVIFTHFLPAQECISAKYLNQDSRTTLLNNYFCNTLGPYIATLENATWLFGHTHDRVDIMIGQTRCLANPVGYPGENPTPYKPLVIEVYYRNALY